MFGCVVHVKYRTPNLKNLDDRSQPLVFIGYEPGSKDYHAYDSTMKKVHLSRDVVFDEQASWDWGAGGDHGEMINDDDTFIMEM
jgi:hypothetical protein